MWVYESMFTWLGVWLPFLEFVQALFNRCSVAPSQLHSNNWAAIRTFRLVCEYLELPFEALFNRCSVAPSQLHSNNWAAIRTFRLVCEYLELPFEVFLFSFLCALPYQGRKAQKRLRIVPGSVESADLRAV
ncbi:hypothetical protein Ahy_A03g014055 [Arachis hypogaea]|uniref:Calponin-homology (CH) domain-containing protein n=1 Tax=Arachis hypogaea TaxID=3818 RepID=A0A445DWV4_ARAHY|nr:hypothetical protein Ahy_A03g014055 [Arachis hypogaea]